MDINTLLIAAGAALAAGILSGLLCAGIAKRKDAASAVESARREIISAQQTSVQAMVSALTASQKEVFAGQDKHIADLKEAVLNLSRQQEEASGALRKNLTDQVTLMRDDNDKKLGEIRATVEEKLQKTLDERLTSSFKQVSERLEQVYKGLGEMQTLAVGVGDLKKVLSNVKTRGTLGEVQLGAILEQILAPEQYDSDIVTIPGTANKVEFAVKLPGANEGETVYLPIDAKFPLDRYGAFVDAEESGDEAKKKEAWTLLSDSIKKNAKDIAEKYISPPHTTDFGILFLPVEGLYAEIVRSGLPETLQAKYRINIAGPTTMAALLNSLQMGFRTLAIQKRSGEVWNLLSAIKSEFDTFESVLRATQNRINQANRELDTLVGTRTRAIQRKLKSVSALPNDRAREVLEIREAAEEDGEAL